MKGIVLQLQEDALSDDTDVLSLLRKAYLISRKLEIKDFQKWIEYEQHGYPFQATIPEYRKVTGEIRAWNPYRGWIPVLCNKTTRLHTQKIYDPLASIKEIYKTSTTNTCLIEFSAEVNKLISSSSPFATKYALFIPTSMVFNVLEQVRIRILEWTLTLESNGIVGEDLQFTPNEIEKASKVAEIRNYTNNFYASVSNTQVQLGTEESMQNAHEVKF